MPIVLIVLGCIGGAALIGGGGITGFKKWRQRRNGGNGGTGNYTKGGYSALSTEPPAYDW
jgi:hypothetical protein